MFEGPQDIEIATLIGMILVFETWERLRPARRVDRFSNLGMDLLSFGFALLANRASTGVAMQAVDAIGPRFALDAARSLQELPAPMRILLAMLVVDFLLYWLHRTQHRSEWLWRTHTWHHSIENLYWFSGFRTSFMHSLLYNIPQTTVPLLLFGLSPLETGIIYAIGIFIQFWEHTNLRVGTGPLRFAFVTPRYHRIHHAATDHRNLALVFPIWDKLFGTQVDPRNVDETFPLGLGEPVEPSQVPRMFLGV